MTLKERIEYAMDKDVRHDFIAEKNGKYVSGPWDELEYAESKGWTYIGTVAALAKEYGMI